MRGLLRITALGTTLLACAAPAATAATSCPGADVAPTRAGVPDARAAVLCLVNAERARHDLRPLRAESRLRASAQAYADALGDDRTLRHVGPDGSTPRSRILATGYGRSGGGFGYGESLGRSKGAPAAPQRRVASWLRAATGRKLLLAPDFRELGVGIAVGPTGTATFVLNVGYRLPAR